MTTVATAVGVWESGGVGRHDRWVRISYQVVDNNRKIKFPALLTQRVRHSHTHRHTHTRKHTHTDTRGRCGKNPEEAKRGERSRKRMGTIKTTTKWGKI